MRAKRGGDATGPNPTDRGEAGSKYHLGVDQQGVPLAADLSAANVHDSRLLEPLVDAIPPTWRPVGEPGRPRRRPAKLHGDKGYDCPPSGLVAASARGHTFTSTAYTGGPAGGG